MVQESNNNVVSIIIPCFNEEKSIYMTGFWEVQRSDLIEILSDQNSSNNLSLILITK